MVQNQIWQIFDSNICYKKQVRDTVKSENAWFSNLDANLKGF